MTASLGVFASKSGSAFVVHQSAPLNIGTQVVNGAVSRSKVEGACRGSPDTPALCVPNEKQQLQHCPTAGLLRIHLPPTQRQAGTGEPTVE